MCMEHISVEKQRFGVGNKKPAHVAMKYQMFVCNEFKIYEKFNRLMYTPNYFYITTLLSVVLTCNILT